MQHTNSLQEKIQKLQDQYYSTNKKNTFLKNSQKQKCAKHITEHIPLKVLLEKSFYIKENTNHVVNDYVVFKTYANPSNYNDIVEFTMELTQKCIKENGSFELHVNLDTFTITAAQRYSELIKIFCEKCLKKQSVFYDYMDHVYIFKYPSMIAAIQNVFSAFMDKEALNKVTLVK